MPERITRVEGYIKGRPDSDWWLAQIKAGEEFRNKCAHGEKWDTWRKYYRGQWDKNIMPVNLFFTMVRSVVPRIYFRNPTVSISPGAPGIENMIFSKVVERVDNRLLHQMRLKRSMKRSIQDTTMFGTGVLKLGFGGFHDPGIDDRDTRDKGGNLVEYFSGARQNMPWISRVQPGKFIVPAGLESWDHARWCAEGPFYRPVEDVRNDPRFENTTKLKDAEYSPTASGDIKRRIQLVKLYEVHDTKTGKVFVIAPDHGSDDKVILYKDDAMQSYTNGLPYFPIQFNPDDEYFWAVPDSQILEPYQLDINDARTSIMKHRRATIIKLLALRKSIPVTEAEKLVSEDVNPVVFVDGDKLADSVKQMQAGGIPPELFQNVQEDMQDVRESLGFSRNEFGTSTAGQKSHSQTTAFEASVVKAATDIRVDERRDDVADNLVDIVSAMHPMIFENWGEEQVVDIVGPGGIPVWVRLGAEGLRRGRFNVKVDPDTGSPDTRESREQRAVVLYERLKTNPMIDPVVLTQYLLHELKGSQFDDMMRQLPPNPGLMGQGPLDPQQAAQMIGQSVQQSAASTG